MGGKRTFHANLSMVMRDDRVLLPRGSVHSGRRCIVSSSRTAVGQRLERYQSITLGWMVYSLQLMSL